jgi:hypothetical protein
MEKLVVDIWRKLGLCDRECRGIDVAGNEDLDEKGEG